MSDQVTIEGREYISSKRAAELSGYAQDYIGQLARKGLIDTQKVGGLWYVSMESVTSYKSTAETFRPEPPVRKRAQEVDSLLSFDGKDYISSSHAAETIGYHQDYVGQLARSGTVLSRQIGNRWYVEREGLIAHKAEKDRLLAMVQAESVGIRSRHSVPEVPTPAVEVERFDDPLYSYQTDAGDLLPSMPESRNEIEAEDVGEERVVVPISIRKEYQILEHKVPVKPVKIDGRVPRKTIFYGSILVSALAIVIVGVAGFSTIARGGMYAAAGGSASVISGPLVSVADRIGDVLESVFVPDLTYQRSD